jgi:hypothetical protein
MNQAPTQEESIPSEKKVGLMNQASTQEESNPYNFLPMTRAGSEGL